VFCNRLHEKRRHAVAHPRPFVDELPLEPEPCGEGGHQLDLADGQVANAVGVNEARCAALRRRLLDRRARFLGVQPHEAEVFLAFLPGQHPVGLAGRVDPGLFQLIAGIGPANCGRRLLRRNPGIDPLRPGPQRSRNDGIDRNGLIK